MFPIGSSVSWSPAQIRPFAVEVFPSCREALSPECRRFSLARLKQAEPMKKGIKRVIFPEHMFRTLPEVFHVLKKQSAFFFLTLDDYIFLYWITQVPVFSFLFISKKTRLNARALKKNSVHTLYITGKGWTTIRPHPLWNRRPSRDFETFPIVLRAFSVLYLLTLHLSNLYFSSV